MYRAIAIMDEAAARALSAVLLEDETTGVEASAAVELPDGTWLCEALYASPPDPDALARYAETMLARPARFSVEKLPDIDWVAKSLEGLSAVTAGRFVVHGRHDRSSVPAHAIGIEIEAAQAFGTGHHATTRGCLVALDRLAKRHRFARPLDLGCGSGVLAIAMAKRLRTPVLASDIDPLAARIAGRNARLNGVGRSVEAIAAAGLAHRRFAGTGRFDLIVANILARPLVAMAGDIAGRLAPGGRLVLSGLRTVDAKPVLAAYRARGLRRESRVDADGWTTLVLAHPHRQRGSPGPRRCRPLRLNRGSGRRPAPRYRRDGRPVRSASCRRG